MILNKNTLNISNSYTKLNILTSLANHIIFQTLSILILLIILQKINIDNFEIIGLIFISVGLSYLDYITWNNYKLSSILLLLSIFIIFITYTNRKQAQYILNKIINYNSVISSSNNTQNTLEHFDNNESANPPQTTNPTNPTNSTYPTNPTNPTDTTNTTNPTYSPQNNITINNIANKKIPYGFNQSGYTNLDKYVGVKNEISVSLINPLYNATNSTNSTNATNATNNENIKQIIEYPYTNNESNNIINFNSQNESITGFDANALLSHNQEYANSLVEALNDRERIMFPLMQNDTPLDISLITGISQELIDPSGWDITKYFPNCVPNGPNEFSGGKDNGYCTNMPNVTNIQLHRINNNKTQKGNFNN